MSKPLILVTGATGTVGREVAQALAKAGHMPRAVVRDPSKAASLSAVIEIAKADLLQPETLRAAFEGVDSAFIVAPPTPNLEAMEANACEAAMEAGVRHIVYLFS